MVDIQESVRDIPAVEIMADIVEELDEIAFSSEFRVADRLRAMELLWKILSGGGFGFGGPELVRIIDDIAAGPGLLDADEDEPGEEAGIVS